LFVATDRRLPEQRRNRQFWLVGTSSTWRRPGARCCLSLTDPTGRPSRYHLGATRSIKVIGQARAALYPGPAVALAVVPEASNPPRLRDFPGFLRPLVFAFPASRPATEASCAGSKRERSCAVPSRRRERPLGAALMLTATNLNPKMIQATPRSCDDQRDDGHLRPSLP
jgi:hypothetical protein